MNKNIFFAVLISLLLAVGFISCGKAEPTSPYKIGAVVAQTGQYAGLGTQSLQGMQLQVDRINESGGINGIPVELIVYDDKSEATEANLMAKKLFEVDKVHAMLAGTATNLSTGVMQVGNEAELPTVVILGTALLLDQLGKWVFTPMGTERDFIPQALEYLSQELGISEYAFLGENSGFGQGGKVFLPQLSPHYNLTIAEEQYFDPGATDLTPQLTNIKDSEAQAIFIWGSSPTAAMAVKQAREMGILLPIMATPSQASPPMVESFGDYYEMEPSLLAVTNKIDIWQQLPDSDPDKAMYREFNQLFTDSYGRPASFWNVLGAQMVLFVEDGLRRAQPDPRNLEEARSELRDALENTKELQLLTGIYTMSPDDHYGLVWGPLIVVTFKDGEMVYLP